MKAKNENDTKNDEKNDTENDAETSEVFLKDVQKDVDFQYIAHSEGVDFRLEVSGANAPYLEIEYLRNNELTPTKESISLAHFVLACTEYFAIKKYFSRFLNRTLFDRFKI